MQEVAAFRIRLSAATVVTAAPQMTVSAMEMGDKVKPVQLGLALIRVRAAMAHLEKVYLRPVTVDQRAFNFKAVTEAAILRPKPRATVVRVAEAAVASPRAPNPFPVVAEALVPVPATL